MKTVALLSFLIAAPASAGEGADAESAGGSAAPEPGDAVRYAKITDIDFRELNVDGELTRPLGTVAWERRRAQFTPLLQLRADFDREMAESVTLVR
jgi:hypothetical protein